MSSPGFGTLVLFGIWLASCGGALNNSGQTGTAGTGGSVGSGGDIAVGGRGGLNTAGTGGVGGTAGQSWGGDAGSTPCYSTPPGVPDGGYAPGPPDSGPAASSKPGCARPYCGADVTETVPLDDDSLGFTAVDLLAQFNTPGIGQLTWYDGTSTTLHFQIRYAQPAVYIDRSTNLTAPGACQKMRVGGAVISLSTDDGRLSGEEFSTWLVDQIVDGSSLAQATVEPLYVSTLHGSLRAPDAWNGGVQTLDLLITPQPESCNSGCSPSADQSAFAFSNTTSNCGYDGKIMWNGQALVSSCIPAVTVAAWQWSPASGDAGTD